MGTQLFSLKWRNHQKNMLTTFECFLSNEILADVTLACEGLSLKAHKVVLSASSPFFQSLFLENPCKHPVVIMKDIKFSHLKAIIEFVYRGEVSVPQDQLAAFLKTAEALKVKGLTNLSDDSNWQTAATSVKSEEHYLLPLDSSNLERHLEKSPTHSPINNENARTQDQSSPFTSFPVQSSSIYPEFHNNVVQSSLSSPCSLHSDTKINNYHLAKNVSQERLADIPTANVQSTAQLNASTVVTSEESGQESTAYSNETFPNVAGMLAEPSLQCQASKQSEHELKEQTQRWRVISTPVNRLEHSSDSDGAADERTAQKKKKAAVNKVNQDSVRAILKRNKERMLDSSDSDSDELVAKSELSSLKKAKRKLEEENMQLLAKMKKLEEELEPVKKLNYDLHTALPLTIFSCKVEETESVTSSHNDMNSEGSWPVALNGKAPDNSKNADKEEKCFDEARSPGEKASAISQSDDQLEKTEDSLYQREDKVCIGNNVYIGKDKLNFIQMSRTNSIFIKNMAVALWGTDVLRERSVSGKVSNRIRSSGAVAKRPLTPTKLAVIRDHLRKRCRDNGMSEEQISKEEKLVGKCISEKIADLNRRKYT